MVPLSQNSSVQTLPKFYGTTRASVGEPSTVVAEGFLRMGVNSMVNGRE